VDILAVQGLHRVAAGPMAVGNQAVERYKEAAVAAECFLFDKVGRPAVMEPHRGVVVELACSPVDMAEGDSLAAPMASLLGQDLGMVDKTWFELL
jgi:hypothetical protein